LADFLDFFFVEGLRRFLFLLYFKFFFLISADLARLRDRGKFSCHRFWLLDARGYESGLVLHVDGAVRITL